MRVLLGVLLLVQPDYQKRERTSRMQQMVSFSNGFTALLPKFSRGFVRFQPEATKSNKPRQAPGIVSSVCGIA